MNIEMLRDYCLSLPKATEDIKWGNDLCFCIHTKMFCVTGLNNDPMMVSLKVTPEEYDKLVGTENIISAPYVGRYKWILIQHPKRFTDKEWKRMIKLSYELIGEKKTKNHRGFDTFEKLSDRKLNHRSKKSTKKSKSK